MLLIILHALSFATAPLLSMASPFKIFVFSQAIYHGWRRSLWLALTPLLADIPVALLIWLIVSQLPAAVLGIFMVQLTILAEGLFDLFTSRENQT